MLRLRTALFVVSLFSAVSGCQPKNETPYYAFHPSTLGSNWKQLRHQVFGFTVDVPASWTFGVAGGGAEAVALLFEEGLNTAQLSESYATLELGSVPRDGRSDLQIASLIIVGMRTKHPDLRVDSVATVLRLRDLEGVGFAFSWRSQSGFTIVERVVLLGDGDRLLSVNMRATTAAWAQNSALYQQIRASVRPIRSGI